MASYTIKVDDVEHVLTKEEYDEFCEYADLIIALSEMYDLSDVVREDAYKALRSYVLANKKVREINLKRGRRRTIFPKFPTMEILGLN
jgi:hypothetical protein